MKRLLFLIVNLNLVFLVVVNITLAQNSEEKSILQLGLDEVIKRVVDTNEGFKIKGTGGQ